MAAPCTYKIGTKYAVPGRRWAAGHHTGVDFLTPTGATLEAPADSKILHAGANSSTGWGRAYGIHVIGESKIGGRTYRWMCAHMSSASVKAGQSVRLGATLGKSGATGNVTGPHCHFEVRIHTKKVGTETYTNFEYGTDVNPDVLLKMTAAAAKPAVKVTAENFIYEVTASVLNGRDYPGSGRVVKTAKRGAKITGIGHMTLPDGSVWVKNIDDLLWWAKKYLKVRPEPGFIAENVIYEVTASVLNGRDRPVSGAVKATAKRGAKITSIGYKPQPDGSVWVRNVSGFWWSKKYLKVKTAAARTVPMRLRPMTFNLPDGAKLPKAPDRVKAGVALAKAHTPDFIGFQELVGPGKDGGKPSAFAASVVKEFGAGWQLVTPTTAWNENYVVLNTAMVSLVEQYPDTKIYAKVGSRAIGGRHVTRMVLKDVATGGIFALGVTQLVNDDHDGAQAQAPLVLEAMQEVSEANGDCPIVIVGDMNVPDDLAAFTEAGLANIRHGAKASTNADYATYTNHTKTKPSTDDDWIIDHIYVPAGWAVRGYTVLLELDADGTFGRLRPSDHAPVLGSVESK